MGFAVASFCAAWRCGFQGGFGGGQFQGGLAADSRGFGGGQLLAALAAGQFQGGFWRRWIPGGGFNAGGGGALGGNMGGGVIGVESLAQRY